MATGVSIGVDVPDLEAGIRFYRAAFGLAEKSRPLAGVAVLEGAGTQLCLLEKPPGSRPAPQAQGVRGYQRHWTPVHLDFHVDDLRQALAQAERAGAKREQRFESSEHGSAAICSDPSGHGFCLLERRPRRA
jgi:predicted enzyme related to lactoylglutathione lyase